MRIGHGYDVHRLVSGRPCIIGGVNIPFELGLDGHSDADVLTHAVMDSLLGALALGDIGKHFPDTDPRYKGADSIALLRHVAALVRESGWQLGNLDATVLAQAPKLAPHILQMRENLAAAIGCAVEQVHFHEVGALDALADVLCVCALMDALQPQRVLCSPINVGSGQVRCAHGVLPVPAPATERLLRGVPVYAGSVTGELCTPTGAALLRQFVSDYGAMPQMCVSAAGYGTGKKDFAAANVVRVLLGENGNGDEQVVELCCNIDDQPAESLAIAMDELLALGALDVYFTAAGMKKSRPGVVLTCLCRPEQRDAMLRCIFRNTTSLGVRERTCARYSLARCTQTVQTRFGPVRVKTAQGYGITREKAEYDDLARCARESGRPLDEIRAAVTQALRDRSEIDIPQT